MIIKNYIKHFVLMLFILTFNQLVSQNFKIVEDKLNGSKLMILEPAKWNKKILIYAHGYRVENAPLSADIQTKNHLNSDLADEGWIVASTSYRRNGMIIRDAITDIEELRNYLVTHYGNPEQIFLYGISMGGKIVTLLAEQDNTPYTAAFALGAALDCNDPDSPTQLAQNLKIPVLFISNKTETKGPEDYINKLSSESQKAFLWTIDRSGHCNISNPENKSAFMALVNFVQTGKIDPEKTIRQEEILSKTDFRVKDNTLFAKALGNSNLKILINEADLAVLGIKKGDYFEIGYQNRSFKVFLGDTYSDVAPGHWIAFFEANGGLKIARNYANAKNFLRYNNPESEIFVKKKTWKTIPKNTEIDSLLNRSVQLILDKKYTEALKILELLYKKDKNNSDVHISMISCYLLTGQQDKAETLYKKVKGKRMFNAQGYYDDQLKEDLDYFKSQGISNDYIESFLKNL